MKSKLFILQFLNLVLLTFSCTNVYTNIIKIENIEILGTSQEEIPQNNSLWEQTTLPFNIKSDRQHRLHTYYWFKFDIEKPSSSEQFSLYFKKFQLDLTVYLNGKYIGSTYAPKGKNATGWHSPLLINIQESNWIEGKNQVTARLTSGSPTTLLNEIYLGETYQLQSFLEKHNFLNKQMAQISMVISAIASFISIIIWLYRREDNIYLLFSLLTAAWIIPLSTRYFSYAPFSSEYFFKTSAALVDISMLLLFLLANQTLNLRFNKTAKTLVLITLITSAVLFYVPSTSALKIAPFLILYKILVFMICVSLYFLKEKKRLEGNIWVLATFIFTISVISFDVYQYIYGPTRGWNSPDTYTRHLIPVYVVIFLAYLIKKFLKTLTESEYLNLNLENKITENTKKIEQSYQEKRELELREAEHLEKQRIYKDLHDDVGSKLVSIIHSDNEDNSKEIARSALEYLRNSVSQVTNTNADLSKAFNQICEETQIRCTGANLEATTNIEILQNDLLNAPITNLGYHLTRIIREGLTNIIKHANANNVQLEIIIKKNSLDMILSDDGANFNPPLEHGVGTTNMKYRANELGASISWEKNQFNGCDVIFILKVS